MHRYCNALDGSRNNEGDNILFCFTAALLTAASLGSDGIGRAEATDYARAMEI